LKDAEAKEIEDKRRLEKEEHEKNLENAKAKDALIAAQHAESVAESEADIAEAQAAEKAA
jgi:hypothetical protein